MENEDLSNGTALATIGTIDIDDVPNNGYEAVEELDKKRQWADFYRYDSKGDTIALSVISSLMLLISVLTLAGEARFGWINWVCSAVTLMFTGLTTKLAIQWRTHARELAALPTVESVLPVHATLELAKQEGALMNRVETHRRNVRRLRAQAAPDPEAIEKAAEEERALRSEIGMLAATNRDIAGLLTDGA